MPFLNNTLAALLLLAVVPACGAFDGADVTSDEVERESQRAIDKGERFAGRKLDRVAAALGDRFARFRANQRDVFALRASREPPDGVDAALRAIDAKARQLEARFEELRRASVVAAADDENNVTQAELRAEAAAAPFQQIERALDELQRSLDNIRASLR